MSDEDLEDNYDAIAALLSAGAQFQRRLHEGPLPLVEIETPEADPESQTRH